MLLFAVSVVDTCVLKGLKDLILCTQIPWKVRLFEVSPAKWARIKADGNVKSVAYQPQLTDTYQPQRPWNFFEWDDNRTERQQNSDYLHHLKEYVNVMSIKHGFIDMAIDNGFFSFSIFGRDFVGTTDGAITGGHFAYLNLANGLRFVMELKKRLNLDKGLNCT
jgi:hypothetical protein